jgi:glutamate 5-kinase
MTILVKIGSALISDGSRIRFPWLAQKVWEIATLHDEGHRFVIVSSGAVAAGMELQGVTERPREILDLQLLSGIGQVRLMTYYNDLFRERGIPVSQVLLTHHNFASERERETITQILRAYVARGVIPIINENDMVDKEEFDSRTIFTENDTLTALVATNLVVDMVVLLTDVDGLFVSDPKADDSVAFVDEVSRVTPEIRAMAGSEPGALGLGGMPSKIEAARKVSEAGMPAIIASGHYPLTDVVHNKVRATRFRPVTETNDG